MEAKQIELLNKNKTHFHMNVLFCESATCTTVRPLLFEYM